MVARTSRFKDLNPQPRTPGTTFSSKEPQKTTLDNSENIMEEDTPLLATSSSIPTRPTMATTEFRSYLKPNKPMRYYGKKDHTIVEGWIAQVNSFFVFADARAPYVYHYLNTLFGGEAAIWFRYHFPESVADTLQWETVRDALRGFFIPPNKDRRLQDEWARLHQISTVAEYISRFCNLVMQLPKQEQPMLVDKFIRGLKPKTRIELELKDPQTLDEAFRLADRYDAIVYRKVFNNEISNFSKPSTRIEYEDGGEPMQLDVLHVNKNIKRKHQGTKLRENKSLQKLSDEDRIHLRSIGACFKCRKTGHMARECLEQSKNSPRQ